MARLARPGPASILLLLAICAAALALVFMTIGAQGRWGFILPFRGVKLGAMLLVGSAVATATVLFQTISNNRILTPAIMGFDALYVLFQTAIVFVLGARGLGVADARITFLVETAVMVLFATGLYRALLNERVASVHLLLLVGVVCGALFRSLSVLMQRMIDPNNFAVLQTRAFASFNTIHTELLGIALAIVLVAGAFIWRLLPRLDVLLLGRDPSIGLGIDHRRTTTAILIVVAILVSVSTALVGPVTFFGLLVANVAYRLMPSHRHALVLPAAALVAAIALIGGQLVLERVFALDAALSMVIEFMGGALFLVLLVKGGRR